MGQIFLAGYENPHLKGILLVDNPRFRVGPLYGGPVVRVIPMVSFTMGR
jgi:hypothetical protein